jgi:hypothetical protein
MPLPTMLRNWLISLLLCLLAISGIMLLNAHRQLDTVQAKANYARMPDTVFVDVPKPMVQVQYRDRIIPQAVTVYRVDTLYRDTLEQGRLMDGIRLEATTLQVHTVDKDGSANIHTYHLPHLASLAIDAHGNVSATPQKPAKRTLKKALKAIGYVAMLGVGILIGSHL